MKLTTLGGSAAGVGTRQGCASYLVQSNTTSLVLDMGPDTLLELRTHTDYRQLDGIVISHLHADHILDLVALRFELAHNPVPAPAPIPLYLPPGGMAALDRIAKGFEGPGSGIEAFTDVFMVQEYDSDGTVDVGGLYCTFHPTVHFVPCQAIRVHAPEDRGDLFYSADTGPAADLAAFGKGCAVALIEATDLESNPLPLDQRGHLTPTEAAQFAVAMEAGTLVLTHMWEEREPGQRVRTAMETFTGTVLRATPGLQFSWNS